MSVSIVAHYHSELTCSNSMHEVLNFITFIFLIALEQELVINANIDLFIIASH